MPEARLLGELHHPRRRAAQEKDGVDYHFVDTQTFQQMIDRGELRRVGRRCTATSTAAPRRWSTRPDRRRGIAVFDIDVQGGSAIKRKFPDAVLVFILPPSMEELQRRLRDRKTDSDETIRRRMLAARSEMDRGTTSYDYLIVNDDLERAFEQLKSVVIAERCRRGRVDLAGLGLDRSPGRLGDDSAKSPDITKCF